jgi:hypothetical protein
MRGFGAMCLLRRSRCMFLAPQCAALRCPWMSSPCSARGACPFLCPWSAWCFVYCTSAHVQQNCTVVQYKKKGRTPTNERTNERTNEPRTKFHLIERIILLHSRFKYKEHRHGKNLQVRLWSVPLWSAITTSIATRACVPKFLSSSCFVFHLYLVEF